jgi:two-component system cell cycle sensor histidine kinase/response regulator CckA
MQEPENEQSKQSDRRQTEERLLLFKQAVENSSDAVGMSTPDGKHYYQNKAFDELFGMVGENPQQTLYVDPAVGHEVFRTIMAGGQWTGEVQMYARDRRVLTILLRAYASKDQTGRIAVLVGVHTDITERKRTETELRKAQLITDNIPVGLYLYRLEDLSDDRTLRMVYANPAVKSLTGLGPEAVFGKTLDENFPGLRAQGIPQRYAEVVRTQTPIRFDDIIYGDDRIVLASFSVNAFPLPGNMVGIAFENIAARKQAEEALREAAIKWQTTFNAMESAVWLLDKDMRIMAANDATLRVFGVNPQAVIGRHCWEIVHGTQKPIAECPVLRSRQTLRREAMELQVGSQWYEVTADPVIGDAGALLGFVHVVSNITKRKTQENEQREFEVRLSQTQRLESLGVLAGGIAHDFNNILMAIMGHAELTLCELSPLSPAKEGLSEIMAASKRAAELCEQMLSYAGKSRVERRNMYLGDLIENTLHMLKTCISKKATLNLQLAKVLPCIHGDPAQIRQILMNLVINASDAIGERSGVITISSGAMACSERYLTDGHIFTHGKPGTYAYFEVSDTGCGMDTKTIERIFEPFFTTKFTGRGLGLSAVVGTIHAHEGALRVDSEPGKGSTFRVMFPAIGKAEDITPEGDVSVVWRGSGTVLVVDDEEGIRAISSKQLRRLGLEVLTAEDGRQAVDIYRERRAEIDLVLLDLTMPHMDGEEAFRELRHIDPDVRVILASGYSESDISSRFAGKGLAGCLQKPYTLTKLRSLLSTLLPKAEPTSNSEDMTCPNKAMDGGEK